MRKKDILIISILFLFYSNLVNSNLKNNKEQKIFEIEIYNKDEQTKWIFGDNGQIEQEKINKKDNTIFKKKVFIKENKYNISEIYDVLLKKKCIFTSKDIFKNKDSSRDIIEKRIDFKNIKTGSTNIPDEYNIIFDNCIIKLDINNNEDSYLNDFLEYVKINFD